MRWTYSCPHCEAMLNPDETVILLAEQRSDIFLVGLHPEPGNYRAYMPPGHEVEDGSRWNFRCPVCHHNLTAAIAPDLCALDMVSGGVKHRVYFSRTAGEQATFVVSAEGIERLGTDAGSHSLEMLELI